MTKRRYLLVPLIALMSLAVAAPALACGGLVAPNGTVNLVRTTTLAGYRNGIEHYVTGFEFAGGGGGKFGSIIPLPDVPRTVIRGGDWTLQRLVQEVQPPLPASDVAFSAASPAAESAKVLLETRIDALDITVLQGGGTAVGNWARENGFLLPPDAPEVLDFYAERSQIFAAAQFDADAAARLGQQTGDSTPIHFVIPTDDPWVPLRILSLGRAAEDIVEADVFLLTPQQPNLLPAPHKGMTLDRSEDASDLLLSDLRSDDRMKWVDGEGMWLSFLKIDARAKDLHYDLAIDATGTEVPSPVDAGLSIEMPALLTNTTTPPWAVIALVSLGIVVVALAITRSRRGIAV